VTYKGSPWFNVGRKSFALVWNDRVVLKLDTAHQELLFWMKLSWRRWCAKPGRASYPRR
jgi:hypothetical protein